MEVLEHCSNVLVQLLNVKNNKDFIKLQTNQLFCLKTQSASLGIIMNVLLTV